MPVTQVLSKEVNADSRRTDAVPPAAPTRRLTILYHHRTQSRDGQYVHIKELVDALTALGHAVILIEPRASGSTRFGGEPRVGRAAKRFIPAWLYEVFELGYNLPEFLHLALQCIVKRPDALYQRANLYMLSGVACARLFRLPLLLEVNAPLAQERTKFGNLKFPGLAARLEAVAWRNADHVLPVTDVLKDIVARSGAPPHRIVVIPNGVDLQKFAPGDGAKLRQRLRLEGKIVLGFTGFVREWHHADRIIDLLADSRLPANSHFLIVGDGPVKGALLEQAQRLGVSDRLTITGVVPREEVSSYVRCFDVALQPSVVDYASPLKLLEYMALGRAIIAPDKPNIRELLVNGESALLTDPSDSPALATALSTLANDRALRERLGAAARRVVLERQMTWRHNAEVVAALACALAEPQ